MHGQSSQCSDLEPSCGGRVRVFAVYSRCGDSCGDSCADDDEQMKKISMMRQLLCR